MDVASGLINVLAGLRFSGGGGDEGVHKSGLDICSLSKTGVPLVRPEDPSERTWHEGQLRKYSPAEYK